MYIPPVFWDYTSRKVLTTEWVCGCQLAKSSPAVIERLTPVGVKCFLVQLLETGFFHGDPHPGNMLVNEKGQLVLIDFGLCAEVARPDTESMTATIVHLMEGNVPSLLQDAISLGFLPEDVDREGLLPVLQEIFEQGSLKNQNDAGQKTSSKTAKIEYTPALRRKQFRAISQQLNQVFFDYPFRVPDYFALITRALIVLEGIAVTGDPSFDIFNAAYPYARKHAVSIFGYGNLAKMGAAKMRHK